MAVAHADHILELQHSLDRDEMPPTWMWPFVEEMNKWIERIQRQRKTKVNAPAAGADDEDLQENELMPKRGR